MLQYIIKIHYLKLFTLAAALPQDCNFNVILSPLRLNLGFETNGNKVVRCGCQQLIPLLTILELRSVRLRVQSAFMSNFTEAL